MGVGSVMILILKKVKPYAVIVSLQFGYAGMYIITAICLKRGMNHFVLSVYRHVFATLVVGPFALLLERKTRPKMTLSIFFKITLLGLLEPVMDQNLYNEGLKSTSATFASASINVVPAITFILATIFRLEKVEIKRRGSQGKIAGTVVTVAGAMLMTLYKGPIIDVFFTEHSGHQGAAGAAAASSSQHWVTGTLMLLASCLCWSCFFILQSFTLKQYPAELSLTALVCVMGAVQGTAVTLVVEGRNLSVWALGWDSRLLASTYSGVVCSGIAYYVQGVVNRERGPVFLTAFSPLCMIITAILGTLILAEKLHLGSIIGAGIIIMGLYTVVWGKSKDSDSDDSRSTGKCHLDLPIINNITSTSTHSDSVASASASGVSSTEVVRAAPIPTSA